MDNLFGNGDDEEISTIITTTTPNTTTKSATSNSTAKKVPKKPAAKSTKFHKIGHKKVKFPKEGSSSSKSIKSITVANPKIRPKKEPTPEDEQANSLWKEPIPELKSADPKAEAELIEEMETLYRKLISGSSSSISQPHSSSSSLLRIGPSVEDEKYTIRITRLAYLLQLVYKNTAWEEDYKELRKEVCKFAKDKNEENKKTLGEIRHNKIEFMKKCPPIFSEAVRTKADAIVSSITKELPKLSSDLLDEPAFIPLVYRNLSESDDKTAMPAATPTEEKAYGEANLDNANSGTPGISILPDNEKKEVADEEKCEEKRTDEPIPTENGAHEGEDLGLSIDKDGYHDEYPEVLTANRGYKSEDTSIPIRKEGYHDEYPEVLTVSRGYKSEDTSIPIRKDGYHDEYPEVLTVSRGYKSEGTPTPIEKEGYVGEVLRASSTGRGGLTNEDSQTFIESGGYGDTCEPEERAVRRANTTTQNLSKETKKVKKTKNRVEARANMIVLSGEDIKKMKEENVKRLEKHRAKIKRESPNARDWNNDFNDAIDMPVDTSDARLAKAKKIMSISDSFADTAKKETENVISDHNKSKSGKNEKKTDDKAKKDDDDDDDFGITTITAESLKPEKSFGGEAGGDKFQYENIVFKLPVEKGMYHSADCAMKVANLELQGYNILLSLGIKNLYFPLTAVIDHLGYRVNATALLPINKDTIIYGSQDGGKTIVFSKEGEDIMREVCTMLNIAPHKVGNIDRYFYGPFDIEVHLGFDNKYYIIDPSRIMPSEIIETGKGEKVRGRSLFCLHRPEFIRTLNTPVNPDIMLKICSDDAMTTINGRENLKKSFERHGNKHYVMLIKALKKQIEKLRTKIPDNIELWKNLNLIDTLHRNGFNVRHLYKLNKLDTSPSDDFNVIINTEIISRKIKMK